MSRTLGAKNRKPRTPKTPRTEALFIVRRMLDVYAAENTEVNYQMVLSALAFMHSLELKYEFPVGPKTVQLVK